jgi:hypothetical protein
MRKSLGKGNGMEVINVFFLDLSQASSLTHFSISSHDIHLKVQKCREREKEVALMGLEVYIEKKESEK